MISSERHPTEDVAILKLTDGIWKSFFRFSDQWEGSGGKYCMFGYPEDAAYELEFGGTVTARPDMIYTEGYIRRKISHSIHAIYGTSFFEVSDVAGPGCSGGPIFKPGSGIWDVIGVYVGEKINDRATSVAYAVRADAFVDWVPSILGCKIMAESQNATA